MISLQKLKNDLCKKKRCITQARAFCNFDVVHNSNLSCTFSFYTWNFKWIIINLLDYLLQMIGNNVKIKDDEDFSILTFKCWRHTVVISILHIYLMSKGTQLVRLSNDWAWFHSDYWDHMVLNSHHSSLTLC